MKKLISVLSSIILSASCISSIAAFAAEEEITEETAVTYVEIDGELFDASKIYYDTYDTDDLYANDKYPYYKSSDSTLTLSGTTATCESGISFTDNSQIKKVEFDQYLERLIANGSAWYEVNHWNQTRYAGPPYDMSNTEYDILTGQTYRLRTVFTVYLENKSYTITTRSDWWSI